MNLYLLEPASPGEAWAPFTGVRPLAELRAGIWRVRERWEAALDLDTTAILGDHVAGFHELEEPPVQDPGGPVINSQLHLSGADIESILIRARRIARIAEHEKVTNEDLAFVASEFTPARDDLAVEYQELVAAREATSRAMVPNRFRSMTSAEIARRLEMLRPLIR